MLFICVGHRIGTHFLTGFLLLLLSPGFGNIFEDKSFVNRETRRFVNPGGTHGPLRDEKWDGSCMEWLGITGLVVKLYWF